ncbi:TIGR03986 family type III CRISPR-associated RAMP protein [Leptolyngbya sp. AN03gr2]|uniref:TIGR03986 family type III CRISPR-associated RAMP protein n=1 Tax=unclassified Leptolyngbya TaxID=2650499 RepID=UPI003D31183F
MLPKQARNIPASRSAKAPYNFVELPEQIVLAEPLEPNNQYDSSRHTGRIDCQLTTESPLYIRCGFIPKDYAEIGDVSYEKQTDEQRIRRAAFFSNPANLRPTIPGSSLRGMLRSFIEIASFSKITQVSDQSRFFFRAVAAMGDDPLKAEYNKHIPKKVKAGYLEQKDGRWFIRPALTIDSVSFIWAKEAEIRASVHCLIPLKDKNYLPQYISVSFEGTDIKNYRCFVKKVSDNCDRYRQKGMLVTSGNMRQDEDTSEPNRKSHCVISAPNQKATLIEIDADAIRAYREALSEFQKQPPFDEKMGVLIENRPIFYIHPEADAKVTRFGHNPNFRLPYVVPDQNRVSSVIDFIPESLREASDVDLTDAIFGFVRSTKQEDNLQACAGRIFVEDAICQQDWESAQFGDLPMIPKTLSSPKPTTFQHYLVQKDNSAKKKDLKHYASQPSEQTVIRGHKLYWHQGIDPAIELAEDCDVSDSQKTMIHPIAPKQSFNFAIHFENLSKVELGAILWILNVAADQDYRLSLGMGKPLGMGAIKITHEVRFSDRQIRYRSLFDQDNWQTAEKSDAEKCKECDRQFEQYVLERIAETDHPVTGKVQFLREVPRIKMLLSMLSWSKFPAAEQTRYMTIEPTNEYKERPVLPTPFQVMGECDRDDRQITTTAAPRPKKAKSSEVVSQRSQREAEISAIVAEMEFAIGQIVVARVSAKKGNKLTIEFAKGLPSTQKEPKWSERLEVGNCVRVEISDKYEDGRIRKWKILEQTECE